MPQRVLAELLNVWEQRWKVWWPAQPCSGISPGLVTLCGIFVRTLVKSSWRVHAGSTQEV